MSATAADIIKLIEEKDIKMVDFKIVDINGQFRHVTIPASQFTEDTMKNGIGDEPNICCIISFCGIATPPPCYLKIQIYVSIVFIIKPPFSTNSDISVDLPQGSLTSRENHFRITGEFLWEFY